MEEKLSPKEHPAENQETPLAEVVEPTDAIAINEGSPAGAIEAKNCKECGQLLFSTDLSDICVACQFALSVTEQGRGQGRPTEYSEDVPRMAYQLCLMGAIDKDLAEFFGVCIRTINNWKNDHPEFLKSVMDGKDTADARVSERLYMRAMGYSHPEEKIFCNDGEITRVETTKHYPPDTQAIKFWMTNRQGKFWKDRQEIEQFGKGGGPIDHKCIIEFIPAKRIE